MVRRHSNDGCVAVNRGGALSTPGVFQRHTVRDFPVFSPTVAADGSRSWRLPRRDGLRLRTTPASRRAKPLHCLTHPHGQSAFTAPFLQPLRILLTPTPPPVIPPLMFPEAEKMFFDLAVFYVFFSIGKLKFS